ALLAIIGLSVGFAGPTPAALVLVDDDNVDCPQAQWHRINDAINAALPGDEVHVCIGTYPDQIVLNKALTLSGEHSGSRTTVIQPVLLPVSKPSIVSQNPITAGIIIDTASVVIDTIDIDMSKNSVAGCSPQLAGIYVRNGNAFVLNSHVHDTRVAGG